MPSSIELPENVFVGEYTDRANRTGVSVIYFEGGAVAGVYKYGGATSTRQIDSLEATHTVSRIDAITLAGGSAFGLDACCGVMRWLKEHDKGTDIRGIKIPIVPGAVIFDLRFSTGLTPDCNMGYLACNALSKDVHEGSSGAGTGATVGKILGIDNATKAGAGTACARLRSGTLIWVYVVVNAFGDVMDKSRRIIAGARKEKDSKEFLNTSSFMTDGHTDSKLVAVSENTTLCVIVTDAYFDKSALKVIAKMASSGFARSLSPAGASFDGDIIFAVSAGNKQEFMDIVGDMSAHLVEDAIRSAIIHADGFGILPSYKDIMRGETNAER
jgi:L-aminopeptidase/D-esterase-like protein